MKSHFIEGQSAKKDLSENRTQDTRRCSINMRQISKAELGSATKEFHKNALTPKEYEQLSPSKALSTGDGGTQESLIRVGFTPRSNPLSLYTSFDRKGTPFVCLVLTNTPFIYT